MSRQILVPLLKTIIFLNVMKIVSPDDNSSLHLHALNSTGQNTTTNGDVAGKWTLLVNIVAFYSLKCYEGHQCDVLFTTDS